jgi:hypothetical protein
MAAFKNKPAAKHLSRGSGARLDFTPATAAAASELAAAAAVVAVLELVLFSDSVAERAGSRFNGGFATRSTS